MFQSFSTTSPISADFTAKDSKMTTAYDSTFGSHGDVNTPYDDSELQNAPSKCVNILMIGVHGLQNKHIAFVKNVSVQTIKNQNKDIFAIVRVKNRSGLANKFNTSESFREMVKAACDSEALSYAMARIAFIPKDGETNELWKAWESQYGTTSEH